MLSKKENVLRCYRHELPEYLPDPGDFHHLFVFSQDMERPANDCAAGRGKDWFGVEYVFEETGAAPLPDPAIPPLLNDVSEWREKVVFPDLESFDWEKAAKEDKVDEIDRENLVFSLWILNGVFERFQTLLGMEEAFVAMLSEPKESFEFLSAICDYKIVLYKKLFKYYNPDIIMQHDDYGTQKSMMISPELWRELVKPQIKRLVEVCHENGVFYEQHSCGFIEPIVPDLAEIEVDGWQGMHINDVPKLKKLTGNDFNYFMSLNLSLYEAADMAGELTEEALRKDVRNTVVECSKGGGYIPFYWAMNPEWWGAEVIADEILRCREAITYE